MALDKLLLVLDVFLLAICVTSMTLASVYFYDCPIAPIPIAVIVTSSFGILSLIITIFNRQRRKRLFKQQLTLPQWDPLSILEYCLAILLIASFVTTSVWVFMNQEAEFENYKSPSYCNKIFYKIIFISSIVIYVTIGIVLLIVCCIICLFACCAALWSVSTTKEPENSQTSIKAKYIAGSYIEKMHYLRRIYSKDEPVINPMDQKKASTLADDSRSIQQQRKSDERFKQFLKNVFGKNKSPQQRISTLARLSESKTKTSVDDTLSF